MQRSVRWSPRRRTARPFLVADCGAACVLAPGRRRHAELPFERAIERGFGFVTDIFCDRRERPISLAEMLRGELEAPLREVLHRRHAEQGCETLREPGTRHPHAVGELFNG